MLFNNNKLLQLMMCTSVISVHGAQFPPSIFSEMSSYLSERTQRIATLQEHKTKLNTEFMQSAQINNAVSYLYYPYYGDTGHAELEVTGSCLAYKSGNFRIESFDRKMVRDRGDAVLVSYALPFYRYVISITPHQLKHMEQCVEKMHTNTLICSFDALTALDRGTNYSVPLLARLSPFVSACYLSIAKSLGSERIKKIEFYRGRPKSCGLNELSDAEAWNQMRFRIAVCAASECLQFFSMMGVLYYWSCYVPLISAATSRFVAL